MTLAALLALASPLSAQITADIDVFENGASLGIITIELDHVKAPVATANFIGLATGKFPWIDSTTGVVRQNTPYYNGIIFHRVIAGFMNQTGSQKGDGSDGPGYNFLDGAEVTNGLNHDAPFVVSMANSGPNSNGSQIFLTAAPASHLNGIHIVFGKIATGASQTLVTTINDVPVNSNSKPLTDVTIDSITVNYNGVTFDPCDQGLPIVSVPTLSNTFGPSSTSLDFSQPPGSFFHASYSSDLVNWEKSTSYLDGNDGPETSFALPPAAIGNPNQFLATALVTYDDPSFLFPSSLANQTFTADAPNLVTPITFVFDSTGETAAWTYDGSNGTAVFLSGHEYNPNAFGTYFIMNLQTSVLRYWQFSGTYMTTISPTEVTGNHSVNVYFPDFSSAGSAPGTFTLTR